MEREERIKIGITPGDGSRLHYETLLKLFDDTAIFDLALPFVYGVSKTILNTAKAVGYNDFSCLVFNKINEIKGKRLQILEPAPLKETLPSAVIEEDGFLEKQSFSLLETALSHLQNRELKALISLPVSAEKIRKIEPEFKNQTHFIAQHFEGNPFKILLCEDTRLSFLSTSTLKNVEEVLTPECIEHRINVFYKALQTDFACTTPRIAVVSMNKDLNSEVLTSADNGVKQTISSLLKSGKPIFGPFPLTKLLHADKERRAFDGILCMYKEQVDFLLEKGMSDSKCFYTAGLPIIHAEPVFSGMDKGAAFNSLLQALYSVIDIERNRLMYAHLTMDPLTFESIDSYEKQDKE